jgi:hypothetical protein
MFESPGGAPGFTEGISHVLQSLPQEDFLAVLPDLRLAFSVFTPSQIDRIARSVAQLLGAEENEITRPGEQERLYALGLELDNYASAAIG